MTPGQMLQRVPAPAPPSTDEVEGYVPLSPERPEYTSDAMEEDFSISVDLLMNTLPFLRMLGDADLHFDFMSDRMREQFKEHTATVEDFTGQWLNS